MGPRTMPNFQNPLAGKVEVTDKDGKFEIDLAKVEVKLGGVDLGSCLIYRMEQ